MTPACSCAPSGVRVANAGTKVRRLGLTPNGRPLGSYVVTITAKVGRETERVRLTGRRL